MRAFAPAVLALAFIVIDDTARAQETEPPGEPSNEGAATTHVEPAAVAPESPTDVAEEPPTEMRAPPFGARGHWLITGESNRGPSWLSYDASNASTFTASFSPGIEYFLVRNVSVGLDVDISYSDSKGYGADGSLVETTTTMFAAGPRLGVNIPLGRMVSWYLRESRLLVSAPGARLWGG